MRIRKNIRTAVAFTLSVIMVMSNCIGAFADDRTEPVRIENGIEVTAAIPIEVTVLDGDIIVDESGYRYQPALEVEETDDDDEDRSIEVTGDVTRIQNSDSATAIEITNSSDNELTVTVDQDVTVVSNGSYSDATGIIIDSNGDEGETDLEIKGEVYAEASGNSSSANATGIEADARDGSSVSVAVGNDVQAHSTAGSEGISGSTSGEGSALTIEVSGNVSATAERERSISEGIDVTNRGGTIDINIAGDVIADGVGIEANSSSDIRNTGITSEEDIKEYEDLIQLSYEGSDGEKGYSFDDRNGTSGYYYTDADGNIMHGSITTENYYESTTTIAVDGTVEGDISADAVKNNTTEVEVGEDVEGSIAVSASNGGSAKVVVAGEVNYETQANYYYNAYGVTAYANNGKAEVSIGEDLTINNTGTNGYRTTAINAQTLGEDSELKISVGGDAAAKASTEDRSTSGMTTVNKGGTIEVEIAGDIVTSGAGINASAVPDKKETRLNKPEDIEAYKDIATYEYTDYDGRQVYFFEDNNISGYYYVNEDGSFAYGYKTITTQNKGSTAITVGGSVEGNISAEEDVNNNRIDIDVEKDVKGNINTYADGDNSHVTIDAGNDITGRIYAVASGKDSTVRVEAGNNVGEYIEANAYGENTSVTVKAGNDANGSVSANADEGNTTKVTVEGAVNNETSGGYSTAYGINGGASDGGRTEISVGDDVNALNKAEDRGNATAINAVTSGEYSELKITVAGDASSKTEAEGTKSAGIKSTNKGGTIEISVAGDVTAEGTGISASTDANRRESYLGESKDVEPYKDIAVLSRTYSSGRQYYTFDDGNGTSGYYYVNADGSFSYGYKTVSTQNKGATTISVGGSVDGSVSAQANAKDNSIDINVGKDANGSITAKATGDNTYAVVKVGNDVGGSISATSNGENTNVLVETGNNVDGGVSATAAEGDTATVIVKGEVNYETTANWSDVYGLNATTTNGTTEISIGDDLSVLNKGEDYASATAINAATRGKASELKVSVAGDASAEASSGERYTTGIATTNRGGTIDVSVAGDVVSNGTGINARSNADSQEFYLNKSEDIEEYKDIAVFNYSESDGRKCYYFEKNDVNGYYYINADGSFAYGYKTILTPREGSTIISVGGSVEDSVNARANTKDNSIDIDVGKDVNGGITANASGDNTHTVVNVGNNVGGSISATSEGKNTNVQVKTENDADGSITAKATGDNTYAVVKVGNDVGGSISATSIGENTNVLVETGNDVDGGVSATAAKGDTATVTVKGKVNYEITNSWSDAYGVNATATNGKTEVSIGDNLSVLNKNENNGGAKAINATTTGKDSEVKVSVAGNVSAEASANDYYTRGIDTKNKGGTIDVNVAGDVVSSGAGIYANSSAESRYFSLNKFEDVEAYKNIAVYEYTVDDGRKYYTFEDDGVSGYYYVNSDGSFDYGSKTTVAEYEGSTTINIDGNVVGEIDAGANVRNNNIDIRVGGNVDNSIFANASEGSTAKIVINGGVNNEKCTYGPLGTYGYGINASADNGKTEIEIGKDLIVNNQHSNAATTAIGARTTGEKSEVSLKVAGDVSALTQDGYSTGIRSTNGGGSIGIEIDGNISSTGNGILADAQAVYKSETVSEEEIIALKNKDWEYYNGPRGEGWQYSEDNISYTYTTDSEGNFIKGYKSYYVDNDGATVITVNGNVTLTVSDYEYYDYYGLDNYGINGIYASNNIESQTAKVTVGGDVSASGGRNTTGASINNQAGTVAVQIGGDVNSSGTGLKIRDDTSETYRKMTAEEIASMKDKFTQYEDYEYEIEDGTVHTYQSFGFRDEDGSYYYYSLVDGEIDYSYAEIRHDKTTNNTIIADGDVISEKTGITATIDNLKGNDSITVGGSVIVEGQNDYWSTGINAELQNGILDMGVGGDVIVTTEKGGIVGVDAFVRNGEEAIQIGGGVFAEGNSQEIAYEEDYGDEHYEWTEMAEILGVEAETYGAESKLTISVADGVTAAALSNPELATAIKISNESDGAALGYLSMTVNGDVSSTGTGLEVDSGDRSREYLEGTAEIKENELYKTEQRYSRSSGEITEKKIYYNAEGDYYYDEDGKMWREIDPESGETDITVIGDVHGDEVGVRLYDVDNTSILIDGTVSGEESAILVSNNVIADSLTLTVWEILPDEEGHYIEQQIGTDEDGNPVTAEDECLLEKVQYIIRIEPTQSNMIRTIGTTEQDGYLVANEDDTVIVKLSIPSDCELLGVTGDVSKETQLLQDENGDYYLVVPRGGGVFLSLNLQRKHYDTYVKATFYPNGGAVAGNEGKFSKSVVQYTRINLPVPQEREGYSFAGWYASDIGPESAGWKEPDADDPILLPGKAEYVMKKDTCFTAIWKKAE